MPTNSPFITFTFGKKNLLTIPPPESRIIR